MTGLKRATAVLRNGAEPGDVTLSLTYEQRLIRRRRVETPSGDVLVDLAEVTSLEAGDALGLEDGSRIAIAAAPEPLIQARGPNLPRLAWHVGNRHAPCQILPDALRLRMDPVLARMLRQLGADVTEIEAPFLPEGGAYGHGRTFGHSHGPADGAGGHSHSHDHEHGAAHGHDHTHAHPDIAPT